LVEPFFSHPSLNLSEDINMTAAPVADPLTIKLESIARAERLARSRALVKNYALGAASLALLPFPLVDQVALFVLDVKMVHELCRLYDVSFKSNIARALIGSLLSGLTGSLMGQGLSTVAKTLPILGTLSAGSFAVSSASITYALGTVFIKHFEADGTLLNIDSAWFAKMLHQALKHDTSQDLPSQPPIEETPSVAAASPA
jgi:uncharacterized protein (DUF697 family)